MSAHYWMTYVEVNDEELDPCKVYYDSSPAEPDVGWAGGLDIELVEYEGIDITGKISSEEMDSLQQRTDEYLTSMQKENRY